MADKPTSGKSFLDDQQSYQSLIAAMPEPARSEYMSYGATMIEAAFPGRKMVVYTLVDKKPSDIEIISFGDFRVDWDNGPSFEVTDQRGSSLILTIPTQLRPREIFLQVPQKFELKYRGRSGGKLGVDFVSHYAVLIKTRSKESLQIEGHTYASTLNNFHARFPDLKIRY